MAVQSHFEDLTVLQIYIEEIVDIVDSEKDLFTLCTRLVKATLTASEWTRVYMATCKHHSSNVYIKKKIAFNMHVMHLLALINTLIMEYCKTHLIDNKLS
jgi:hypothetical protein